MGKISKFFGNPGCRPAVHHQAPMVINSRVQEQRCSDMQSEITATECESSSVLRKEKEGEEEVEESTKSKADLYTTKSGSDSSTVVDLSNVGLDADGTIVTSHSFTGLNKNLTDRILDWLVDWAGGQFVFFLVWVIIAVWVIVGIVFKAPFNWQVVMSDAQSIQSYIWDTLLMRQQLMSTHEQILVCCQLRSRVAAFKNFLVNSGITFKHTPKQLTKEELNSSEEDEASSKGDNSVLQKVTEVQSSTPSSGAEVTSTQCQYFDASAIAGDLPVENLYDKFSSAFSVVLGSVPSMFIFWIGIFVWIACGVIPTNATNTPPYTGKYTGSNPEYCKWSNTWQMYINTATAVCLLVSTTFLQNIRSRHDKFIAKFLVSAFDLDQKIEYRLRSYFKDFRTSNPVISVPEPKRSWGQHLIDWYADVIGTGIGVGIAIAVFGVWIAIGAPMDWNDNWWLIIGTYTGLVGFFDGFVIREVYFRIMKHEEENYQKLAEDDMQLFQLLGLSCPDEYTGLNIRERRRKNSINYKISSFVNRVCSSQWSVLASVITIVGLLATATGLRWSTTGQLIANTPTMIIEEFFLIVLVQAHSWADKQRRIEVSSLVARRHILWAFIQENIPEDFN